jgi:hypothetical protein
MSYVRLLPSDVSDGGAGWVAVMSFLAVTIGTVLVREDLATIAVTKLWQCVVYLSGSQRFLFIVLGCVLLVVTGASMSAGIKSWNNHQPATMTTIEGRTFYELLDPCNDFDYVAQCVAIVGAVPFVFVGKVLPQFMWNDIIVPVCRWMIVNGYNMLLSMLEFAELWWKHLCTRLWIIYQIVERWCQWIVDTFIQPVVRFIQTIINLLINLVVSICTTVYHAVVLSITLFWTIVVLTPITLAKHILQHITNFF